MSSKVTLSMPPEALEKIRKGLRDRDPRLLAVFSELGIKVFDGAPVNPDPVDVVANKLSVELWAHPNHEYDVTFLEQDPPTYLYCEGVKPEPMLVRQAIYELVTKRKNARVTTPGKIQYSERGS